MEILSQSDRVSNENLEIGPFTTERNSVGKAVNHTKRRIEITVESRRRIVLSQHNQAIQSWCDECGEQVQKVTPDEAAQLAHVTTRTIYRWVETARLHFTETERGFLLICLKSLDSKVNSSTVSREEAAVSAPEGFLRRRLMRQVLKRR